MSKKCFPLSRWFKNNLYEKNTLCFFSEEFKNIFCPCFSAGLVTARGCATKKEVNSSLKIQYTIYYVSNMLVLQNSKQSTNYKSVEILKCHNNNTRIYQYFKGSLHWVWKPCDGSREWEVLLLPSPLMQQVMKLNIRRKCVKIWYTRKDAEIQ